MIRVGLRGAKVVKRFGRVAALRGIDFDIKPGEAVAILGANGAGKSTLLRILAGLSRPTDGRFETLPDATPESETTALPREAHRAAIGYVGHSTLLYGELTARENLSFAARLAGAPVSPDAVGALLDQMNLRDVADRRAGTFSRGMSQRLAIARAVVHQPSVLLLDEPFTGLDELSAERLSAQLGELRQGGRTLVLITHDPRRAVELTDRALLLDRGRVVARPGAAPASDRSNASPSPLPEIAFEVDALREAMSRFARQAAEEEAA